jgi:fumarate reductase flavoprotein subunit
MKRTYKNRQGLSRRDFIKTTAAGTGAAAATAGNLLAQGNPAPQTDKYAFETPPPPIPSDRIQSTLSADIVVVGAGTSGLHAAWAASQSGAKVIVVEKMDVFQARGGDNAALNTKIHKKLGITIDKRLVIDDLMKRGEGRLDQNLLNLWADNCGKIMDMIIDTLAAEGMPTYLVIPDRADDETSIIDKWPHPTGFPADWNFQNERYVEYPVCHRPGGKSENQRRWLTIIEKNAKKIGVDFHYGMKAAQLVREGAKGRVTGVIAQSKDGGYVRFDARRALILCTGDYGFNREMVARYSPQMPLPGMHSTSMGEGHQMAMWIGAVMENTPHAPMTHIFHVMGTDAFLQVNRFGKRFYNEDSDSEFMANQAYEQGGLWVVFDDSWEEDIKHMGPGFKRVFRMTDALRKEFQELASGKSGGPWGKKILKADTLEELAQKMEVPVEAFKATVARYNELVKGKKDLDYGKRADRLTAIDKPPYYAEWNAKPSRCLVVLGGLLVNERLQAVDKDGEVIPGLYLGGNTVGRRFKGGYPLTCPGISHSMAFTFGYLAGKRATEPGA